MKFLIIYGSCGHGHQRAAEYIAEELKSRGGNDVTVIDFLDYTIPFCKKVYPYTYKLLVSRLRWLWAISFHLTNIKKLNWLLRFVRKIHNSINGPALEKYLTETDADVVVLTHFFPAEVLSRLIKSGKVSTKMVTVVTDAIAHSTWVNKYSDYFIGLSNQTKEALLKWGIPESKILPLGIPISAKFKYLDKKNEYKVKYGLEPDKLTVLITSGSFGIGPLDRLVKILCEFRHDLQLLVVCANNDSLYIRLTKKTYPLPCKIFGFVDFMHELMEASDIIIAKSGGLTTCESLAKEVPMVISQSIPGQETYNAEFLLSNNAAFKITGPSGIRKIIISLLEDKTVLLEKKRNIQKISKPTATEDIVNFLLSLKGT